MLGRVVHLRNPDAKVSRPRLAVDQLLIAGIKLGPEKKRAAINRVLELMPAWKRGDCWRRIRQLRRTAPLAADAVQPDPKAGDNGPPHRSLPRPWLADEDATLVGLAGYEPVDRIAGRLHRSAGAVRYRLGALGISARVSDGWSQRALLRLLRISRVRWRQLVADDLLRVRDPRITEASLVTVIGKNSPFEPEGKTLPRGPYSWKRAARILGLGVDDVRKLIAGGHLKLADTFVTDRAFEDFCRSHGGLIHMALLDPSTRKWLNREYGVPWPAGESKPPRAQKHALVVRACKCGRKIAGNVYFRHLRLCSRCPRESHDSTTPLRSGDGVVGAGVVPFRPVDAMAPHPAARDSVGVKTSACPSAARGVCPAACGRGVFRSASPEETPGRVETGGTARSRLSS